MTCNVLMGTLLIRSLTHSLTHSVTDWRSATITALVTSTENKKLMLRNPRDRMFYVNPVSAYLVPFSR